MSINQWIGYGRSKIYNFTIGYFYTQSIIRKILASLPDNSTVLDVGVGTGFTYSQNSDIIKQKNLQIVGIDIDPEYVRNAKHAMIDSELENNVKLVTQDIYKVTQEQIPEQSFDFVIFSDSYAVIPDVHKMATFCEKFLKKSGSVIIASTLFDEYNHYIDWVKKRIIYVSTIDFGEMMVKENLKKYISSRFSGDVESCFILLDEKIVPGLNYPFRSYMVKWTPDQPMIGQTTETVVVGQDIDQMLIRDQK